MYTSVDSEVGVLVSETELYQMVVVVVVEYTALVAWQSHGIFNTHSLKRVPYCDTGTLYSH
jgi:hypothetical protein